MRDTAREPGSGARFRRYGCAGRSAVCQAKEGRARPWVEGFNGALCAPARLAQARETPGFFTEERAAQLWHLLFANLMPESRSLCVQDFETTTGLNLVRTHLNSHLPGSITAFFSIIVDALPGCMLQDHELPLADVLQAKAGCATCDVGKVLRPALQVASIRAMSEATAAYQFEHVAWPRRGGGGRGNRGERGGRARKAEERRGKRKAKQHRNETTNQIERKVKETMTESRNKRYNKANRQKDNRETKRGVLSETSQKEWREREREVRQQDTQIER